MAVEHRSEVLAQAQWDVLSPLIEACRPRGKTEPHNQRRTVEAIIWRHDNGAKWRAIPPDLGPWWMAAQTFIRWSRLGVWERLLELAQERGVELGMVFLDGTSVRAHAKAAGAAKRGSGAERDDREALGRFSRKRLRCQRQRWPCHRESSRGGYGTRACVIVDGAGRALGFALAPGQAHELPLAPGLLEVLPDVPGWVVGDRGYASHAFRQRVWDQGVRPAVPAKSNEAPLACPDRICNNRNIVERFWARMKEWHAIATRYEKTANSFMGVLALKAALDWIKL